MNDQAKRAHEPQDLERLLISRLMEADVDGIVALYEPNAVLHYGGSQLAMGREAIRKVFTDLIATGQTFGGGEQQEAIVCDDVALTSTRLSDGSVTAEVARRQSDGTWLWVIDKFSIL